ncbi:hypothetical protein ACOZ38_32880 [Sphaerisporangium viridialbum]|uniref:hypothetical protein n=1 Tax=Sphaerisporangium viridialbum TaxID=46189 RepID=UPI003C7452E4
MIDHGIDFPQYRLHVVPAVVALASPSWQREVWLNPGEFEDLDYALQGRDGRGSLGHRPTRSSIGTRLRRLGRGFGKQHAKKGAVAVADTLLPPCFVIA